MAMNYACAVPGSTEWAAIFAVTLGELFQGDGTGRRVALLSDSTTEGGFTGGGLGNWDIGSPSKRLRGRYRRLYRYAGFESGVRGNKNVDPALSERIFIRMLAQAGVDVHTKFEIADVGRAGGAGTAVTSMTAADGRVVLANGWYDGSVCMDLVRRLSLRGVGWEIGRDAQSAYGEARAGYANDQRVTRVSPYLPNGQLLYGVSPALNLAKGAKYDGVAAVALRTTYTRYTRDRIPFDAGEVDKVPVSQFYNRDDMLLHLARYGTGGLLAGFSTGPMQSGVSDNVILTDRVTGRPRHWDYPFMTYAQRAAFMSDLKKFTMSWNYMRFTDPLFAGTPIQAQMAQYGYPKSAYKNNDNLAWAIYLRETIRPLNTYVMTSFDLTVTDPMAARNVFKADSISIGGYSIDTKSTMNIPSPDGTVVLREGGTDAADELPVYKKGYAIPFRALYNMAVCPNMLTVPSCTSIAWGSIRIVINLCLAAEAAAFAMYEYLTFGTPFDQINVATLRARISSTGLYVDPFAADQEGDEDTDGEGALLVQAQT